MDENQNRLLLRCGFQRSSVAAYLLVVHDALRKPEATELVVLDLDG